MKYAVHILLFCFLWTLPIAQLQAQKKAKKTELSYKDQQKFDRLFIDADKAKILGDYEQAIKLFEQCVSLDPSQPAPHFELATLYMRYGEIEQARKNAEIAAKQDPSNYYFRLLHADILKNLKAYKEAGSEYEEIVKEFPEKFEVYLELALVYILQKKYSEAISTYDRLEKAIGPNEEVKLKKQYLYLQLGDVSKAAIEIEELIILNPEHPKYYLLLAEVYAVNGMDDKADKAYKKAVDKFPHNAEVHMSLSDYYHKKNELNKALEHLQTAVASPDLDIDLKIKTLLSYLDEAEMNPERMNRVMELGSTLLKVHPDDAKAYTINGDIYLNAGKIRESRSYFMRAVELDPKRFPIWSQLMILEADLGLNDTLLIHCNEALGLFPNQPAIYYFRGYANTRMGAYKEAIKDYESGIGITVDNDLLKVQFYLGLGDVYHETGQHKLSDEAFGHVLQIDSNNTVALNNYSYYLSLREEDLDRAKHMSARSNKIEPNQPTYLDTYAWILYQMKDYTEAKTWMEKAIKYGGNDNGVILEHMGDILFQLKDEQEAIKYWNKAHEAGGGSENLEKKLKDGKLYE